MKLTRFTTSALLAAALTAEAQAQGVGTKMPAVELEGYANTPAKSYDDFTGRAVLIEFFAFW